MQKDRIDVIIPAFKAHGTMFRCLSSIVCQTIVRDLRVTIVNDCCPEGSYKEFVGMFAPYMEIREIRLPENRGPGVARQTGIDESDCEFITFIDADDMFLTVDAIKKLRDGMEDEKYKVVSASFYADRYKDDPDHFSRTMVWVFAKLYRREFLDTYKVRFSNSRANEDSGFNRMVYMLCDNPNEQIKCISENVYYYYNREDSITRINGDLYFFDKGICGGIDNEIYALEHVRRFKPYSSLLVQEIASCMTQYYFQYMTVLDKAPSYAMQLWEYIKKFYHTCYKLIENFVTDDAFKNQYSVSMYAALSSYGYHGVIPKYGILEFMHKLQTEEYDPNLIYEIWEEMGQDPEFSEVMKNNIACGVCPEGYTDKPKEE